MKEENVIPDIILNNILKNWIIIWSNFIQYESKKNYNDRNAKKVMDIYL